MIDKGNVKQKKHQEAVEPEEETLTYAQRKKKSDVFASVMRDGINTRKSVFDKTAVFRIGDREDE